MFNRWKENDKVSATPRERDLYYLHWFVYNCHERSKFGHTFSQQWPSESTDINS